VRGFLRDLTWGVAVVAAVCVVIGVGAGVVWRRCSERRALRKTRP